MTTSATRANRVIREQLERWADNVRDIAYVDAANTSTPPKYMGELKYEEIWALAQQSMAAAILHKIPEERRP